MTSCIIEDADLIAAAAQGARVLDWRTGDRLEQVVNAPRLAPNWAMMPSRLDRAWGRGAVGSVIEVL